MLDLITLLGLLCMQEGAVAEWSPGRWWPFFIAVRRTCWWWWRLILLHKYWCTVRVVFQWKRDSIAGTNLVVEGNGGCLSQDFLAYPLSVAGGLLSEEIRLHVPWREKDMGSFCLVALSSDLLTFATWCIASCETYCHLMCWRMNSGIQWKMGMGTCPAQVEFWVGANTDTARFGNAQWRLPICDWFVWWWLFGCAK